MIDIGNRADLARLERCVAAFGPSGYAVVEGAHFADLPDELARKRLLARSLFMETGDKAVEAAGPWLLPLSQSSQAHSEVMALVADKPAIVFWRCDAGDTALFRHLRRLNVSKIPTWAAHGGTEPVPYDLEHPRFSTVMFRHWDPRVLGALLPVLTADQFGRIMGDADEIAFWSDDYGGLKRVIKDDTWPKASPGTLRIDTQQMLALAERREKASRLKITRYLRDVAPDETRHLQDADLDRHIADSNASAARFGLRSERDLGLWAYVMVKYDWRATAPPVVAHMGGSGAGASERLTTLADAIFRRTAQGCASCDECKRWLSEVEKEAQKHSADADDHKRNKNITQAYNDLYKDDPNNKWIGLAGNVSAQVGCSMNGLMRNTSGMTAALGDGNKTIFNNIYPMALFHKRHGLDKMKRCYGEDLPPKMQKAFELMDDKNPSDKRTAANQNCGLRAEGCSVVGLFSAPRDARLYGRHSPELVRQHSGVANLRRLRCH